MERAGTVNERLAIPLFHAATATGIRAQRVHGPLTPLCLLWSSSWSCMRTRVHTSYTRRHARASWCVLGSRVQTFDGLAAPARDRNRAGLTTGGNAAGRATSYSPA